MNQTQGGTLEMDQHVTGSERLNVSPSEGPTVILNGTSGRLSSMIFLVIQNTSL